MLGEVLGIDFDTATKEDIKRLVAIIQQRPYSPWTRHCYKIIIRRFYKWVEGTETYPEKVAWSRTSSR